MKSPRIARVLPIATALLFAVAVQALAGGEKCREKQAEKAAAEAIYTVEGDVQKPRRIAGPAPEYPELPKEQRIEGTVVTRILIEKDGTVSDAEIARSLGEGFDALALDAVRQWSFEPASLDGEPVRVYYDITINYRLGEADDA